MSASPRLVAGPLLLRPGGPGLEEHRATAGPLPRLTGPALVELLESADLRGRGGAGFPLAVKVRTVLDHARRAPVVVNFAEGEPDSQKDLVLGLHHPHRVLDGVEIVARAMRSRAVHLVVPEERPELAEALGVAIADRRGPRHLRLHHASAGFVSGEGSAVVELIHGRPNLPVTSWQPTAVDGVRHRPTVLSNAESYAQVAALASDPVRYLDLGTPDEPGTRLLTLVVPGAGHVVTEVEHGTPWSDVLPAEHLARPVLLGGFHGTWAAADQLADGRVSSIELRAAGLTLGAGVVLTLGPDECPLRRTASIARYLAGQSARRCGPCLNGLPALADAVAGLVEGRPTVDRVRQLFGLVERRGACAHPDGATRMVRSALVAFPDEVAAHAVGRCSTRVAVA